MDDLTLKTIVSPHLDDAVLSAFSLLDSGARVVNVFTGLPPAGELTLWDRLCGASESAEQMRRRIDEDRRALLRFAVTPRNLGFLEAPSRDRSDAFRVEQAVRAELEKIPEDTVIYAPLGGGPRPNPDHVIVRDAARALSHEGRRVRLYADQPYVYKSRAWPHWVTNGGPASAAWWEKVPRAVPEIGFAEDAVVVHLSPEEGEQKRAAMEAYETQFDALNKKLRTRGLLLDPSLYRYELFWELER